MNISNNNQMDNENKKLKDTITKLNNEIINLNSKLNGLQKDKEIITKENAELKKQNNNLLQQLKKIKDDTINKLNNININNDNSNEKEIIKLLNEKLQMKEKEIIDLKNKLANNPNDLRNLMTVIFISTDQGIHYSLICEKTDKFVELEKKLYEIYPNYSECENYYTANGGVIKKFKTLEENKIKNSQVITLHKYDLE